MLCFNPYSSLSWISDCYFLSLNTLLCVFPRQLLLEVENINCIAVDWKEGAKGTYVSAVNNIRVLGAEVAYFITTLQVKDPAGVNLQFPRAPRGVVTPLPWVWASSCTVREGRTVEIQLITLIIGPVRTSHGHRGHKQGRGWGDVPVNERPAGGNVSIWC